MRTSALIKHTPLSVLVDLGSTHNFILLTAAHCCGLSITSYAALQVMIAYGGYLPNLVALLVSMIHAQILY
ncbi:hypothetical protein IFM89_009364 [Coptis chinensis]|uniref:Uncharacterized protein n=1 Tax=Coptis chinensis TaxID=261450 RepID=A0A835HJ70_9MAGN|nr:hypothetical protein IFM89_009364 [Coptis chinensis]